MRLVALNDLMPVASPIRLCLAASATGTPGLNNAVAMNPQPGPAGIGAGLLADFSGVVPSLVGMNVTVFVYYVTSLSALNLNGSSCSQLFAMSALTPADAGPDAAPPDASGATLVQTLDFDVSAVIPAATWNLTSKFLLLVAGCPLTSDYTTVKNTCGLAADGSVPPDYGNFNPGVYAIQLDPTGSDGGARVQGLNGEIALTYTGFVGVEPPFLLGFQTAAEAEAGIPDGGRGPAPAGSYVVGPYDSGLGIGGFNPLDPIPLPAGTDISSLATFANGVVEAQPPVRAPTNLFTPMDQILTLSGLSASDLTGSSFTLIYIGQHGAAITLADGGLNPIANGLRLIRNDVP